MQPTKKNLAIYEAVKNAEIRLWQVCRFMKIRQSELSVLLRDELPDEEKERILSVIAKLGKMKTEGKI
jgi:predicted XRE-type DNA-binding protein